ncbi:MAG TPA: FixH family protein [Bryobacteraceae bacterium]|nr:FixH family protein [Bryobacteraceae bacterium]
MRSLATVLLICLFATACHRTATADSGMTVACEIAPKPARVGTATVTVRLADAATKPVTGAKISLEGDMAHPGMEPVFAKAQETNPGSYVASLNFTMAGDWVIVVQGILPDGSKVERQIDVKGVLPG